MPRRRVDDAASGRADGRGILQGQGDHARDRQRAGRRLRRVRAACWRAISAGTSRAIRASSCRTCRAPAACRAPTSSTIVAPKDGTTFGLIARNMPLLGLLGSNTNVRFDPRKFTWLGSSSNFSNDAYVLIVRKDAPVKIDRGRRARRRARARARRHRRWRHQQRRAENPARHARAQRQACRRLSRQRGDLSCDGARRGERPHQRAVLDQVDAGRAGSRRRAITGSCSSTPAPRGSRAFRTCRPRASLPPTTRRAR